MSDKSDLKFDQNQNEMNKDKKIVKSHSMIGFKKNGRGGETDIIFRIPSKDGSNRK